MARMLGNKIAQKTFVEKSLPQAGALSVLLFSVYFYPYGACQTLWCTKQKLDLEGEESRMKKSPICFAITSIVLVLLYLQFSCS